MENKRISHYQVGRRLGRGGMGEVYEALDLDLDRRVALKFVAPELAANAQALRRFETEARSAAALNHPHIATLYAFERDGDRTFIAMELVPGGSVRDRMQDGPLPIDEALAIARDVARALALAHRRDIAHRDVKPENLMFDEDGVVKLMDFGLARAVQASRVTMTGSGVGTAAYMPPESTGEGAGPPGDVFALGVTLHEMIAGALPFAGDSPIAQLYTIANQDPKPLRQARPDAPEAVEALILKMLVKAPGDRPDAATVARELAAITGVPLPLTAGETEEVPVERIPAIAGGGALEPVARRRRGALPVALLLIGAVALGILMIVKFRPPGPPRAPDPEAVVLNNRGFDLIQRDSIEAARAPLEAALRVDPDYAEAMLNLALVLLKSGDPTRAAALYARVAKEHANEPAVAGKAHNGLAEIDMTAGAYPSAIAHYRAALAHDSTELAYPNNLAFALVRAGRPNEAVPVLARALERFPGEALLHKNLGLARLRTGDVAGALAALNTALDRDPGLASAWGLRAEVRARLEDRSGARKDWDTYLGMAHDETERPGLEAQLRRLGVL
jgi:tetratricopeptide (TPR) repeat protein/tRNA A-37 threonylcarbamoyl transferase component Bud32